jgi:hypothetical protein
MQKSGALETIARITGYVFHPLLMASVAVFVLFNSGHYLSVVNANIRDVIYSIFIILTFVLPALFIPVLYYFKVISSIETQIKKEKLIPLMSVIIIYALAYYFMQKVSMPAILLKVIAASIASMIVYFVILFFWNISIHLSALGGLLGFVVYLGINSNLNVLLTGFLVIIVSGIVASAQLFLQRHNPAQVYVGFITGLIVVYLSMWIL